MGRNESNQTKTNKSTGSTQEDLSLFNWKIVDGK